MNLSELIKALNEMAYDFDDDTPICIVSAVKDLKLFNIDRISIFEINHEKFIVIESNLLNEYVEIK